MSALDFAHPVTRAWFADSFAAPTRAQTLGWPAIAAGESTLILAPTGSGKTLAAFLAAIDRLMFGDAREEREGTRVLYISPLKALGVDVERNLRAPLAGIAGRAVEVEPPSVGVRSGDTPTDERRQLIRNPPDILITTPESLYLMLTSRARETLASVETVIVDEIHSMVATKRGAHLFLSLERLEALQGPALQGSALGGEGVGLQRIGLSATQRPLDEVARLLGGVGEDGPRPVTIVDAGASRPMTLTVEVPVEDMSRLGDVAQMSAGEAPGNPTVSIWPAIHERLLELIAAHRTTMIFCNNRRLAERLAAALNEAQEEDGGPPIARAHHGSVARAQRLEIEDALKRGQLSCIVATSSLELGIDIGSVDLVVQIEAPISVASGLQRVGRAGHQVGASSAGVIVPKFRGDLLACAAAARAMREGAVEETFYPRNPLDVLAQQLVAMVAVEDWSVEEAYAVVRRAACFAELPRRAFDDVLDMLSGRYPSEQFAGLKARLTWDRLGGTLTGRRGAQRVAVISGGTIPDRGNYPVFLAGETGTKRSGRVGELDEEMVFESRDGDVIVLGATSWRVVEITHDRVLVEPAPGEPGRLPFWRGDGLGRPLDLGRRVGALTRELAGVDEAAGVSLLAGEGLDDNAAANLARYVAEQREATGTVPSDRAIVVERFVDEIGDWRVAILSPFGARVHAPWATAVAGQLRTDFDVDCMWSDDGILFRLPAGTSGGSPPPVDVLVPVADEIEALIAGRLGETSLFAARFRENAARALLLPRRYPGQRTPLWLQRRRSQELLSIAAGFPDFPIVLETYRECLREAYDLPGLIWLLKEVEARRVRLVTADTELPSPFAHALQFHFVSQFMYEGDAPLAERRAQALSLDHGRLRELLGEAELRELLDPEAIATVERQLQRLEPVRPARDADDVHQLLLELGDLTPEELSARAGEVSEWVAELVSARRVVELAIAGESRLVAAEDAARMRDALGVPLPSGLPDAFLEPVDDALRQLVSRYARTHGPFTAETLAARYRLGPSVVLGMLRTLVSEGRLLEGEFLPGGRGREWCELAVLRRIKRRSLARLRKAIEPVEPERFARFLPHWQGIRRGDERRRGLDALLDAIEVLEGAPVPASELESSILPARIEGYAPAMLDELCVAGEVVWRGVEALGARDGRVALYLADGYHALAPPLPSPPEDEVPEAVRARVREVLRGGGALFFDAIHGAVGGMAGEVVDALWSLVWAGEATVDTLGSLRRVLGNDRQRRRGRYRSRRQLPAGAGGRWSLLPEPTATATERRAALAAKLLTRYGVVTREVCHAEKVAGGFAAVYPVLREMEQVGKARRGYFVEGLGGAQFAVPGADDALRREPASAEEPLVLAATDPANAWGAALRWPESVAAARPQRAAGARVILDEGRLAAQVGRSGKSLLLFLPDDERRSRSAERLAVALAGLGEARRGMLLATIDGEPAREHAFAASLQAVGFTTSHRGLVLQRRAMVR